MIGNTPNSSSVMSGASGGLANQPIQQLSAFVEEKLSKLGYELVAIEVVNHREKTLRLFIDQPTGITIDDCVKVTHELDQPLETSDVVMAVFKGPYELEVSSPGIDRPLQKAEDFCRFIGSIARIQTFRALTGEETSAAEYSTKNPKQKNFYGILRGFEAATNSILFGVSPEDGTQKIKQETLIRIPMELVSKAHLEPVIELPEESSKKNRSSADKSNERQKTGAKKA